MYFENDGAANNNNCLPSWPDNKFDIPILANESYITKRTHERSPAIRNRGIA